MDIFFALLGPLRAWRGDTELDFGPPKQRSLLALLLAHAGEPVTTPEIVDTLWGQDPPDTAVNVVQHHVGTLRRVLEPGLPTGVASRWLVRGSGGYRLHVEANALDLLRFRALRRRWMDAARTGRVEQATQALVDALSLWRGPVAADILPQARTHPVFAAVSNEYPAAAKDLAEHALRSGSGAVGDALHAIGPAVVQHPLDEALQATWMDLLLARNLRVEALDVHETVRRSLAENLGVEPGPELRAAHRRALDAVQHAPGHRHQGPRAEAGAAAAHWEDSISRRGEAHTPTPPAQLPMSPPVFTGRRTELALLDALLPDDLPDSATSTVIGTITGTAGSGKTALAVYWGHQVANRFPDGQLYIDMRGFHASEAALDAEHAVRFFLNSLDVAPAAVPTNPDAQFVLYRSLVSDRRYLIVLDNVRDTEHVLPLLPAASRSLVLVTSRSRLASLTTAAGARTVTLGPLNEPDAQSFLRHRLGSIRVDREPDAATEIAASCARLPLALAVVTARALLNPSFPLAAIARELREEAHPLDAYTDSY